MLKSSWIDKVITNEYGLRKLTKKGVCISHITLWGRN